MKDWYSSSFTPSWESGIVWKPCWFKLLMGRTSSFAARLRRLFPIMCLSKVYYWTREAYLNWELGPPPPRLVSIISSSCETSALPVIFSSGFGTFDLLRSCGSLSSTTSPTHSSSTTSWSFRIVSSSDSRGSCWYLEFGLHVTFLASSFCGDAHPGFDFPLPEDCSLI